jgi:3',5'-cyclic AMP phosphodiesterase CpdA
MLMSRQPILSMKNLHFLCIVTLLTFSLAVCPAQSASPQEGDTFRLCFVSDTQEPMTFERIVLSYNDNAKARELIFHEILDLRPDAVVHLGDEIALGTSSSDWKEIDQFVGALRKQGTAFCPIPGNHEYLLTSARGMRNFTSRYPDASLIGYTKQFGKIAVVLVNSNFSELMRTEQEEQLSWYQQTLAHLEIDTTVAFVIVGCHHPPFTNSRIVGVSDEIRQSYLPDFYKSDKCKLFVSGHSHAFEHFREHGKDFFVLGGGGGLQHPLTLGASAEYKDVFSDTLQKRMFHFVSMTAVGDTLEVGVRMLKADFSGFETLPQLRFVK